MAGRTAMSIEKCLRLRCAVSLRQFSSDTVSDDGTPVGEGRRIRRRIAARKRALLDEVIRVDHAGEFGANQIYAGQMAVLGNTTSGPVIEHMWEQEKNHLRLFEEQMQKFRARPTVLLPFWSTVGYALGMGTALLGKEAAMACTVAVEEVIGEHYNNQLRVLIQEGVEEQELLECISKCRDEELEHLETGLEHDAELAPGYETLSNVIKVGCRVAIAVAEKV